MACSETDENPWVNRRRDARITIRIPCRIEGPDYDTHATILNLSIGGAGIGIVPGLAWFDFRQIQRVQIKEIGALDIMFRWRSSDRLGVAFRSRELARSRVGAYFRSKGILNF